jgi:tetratricopeptide (TPR) repeat protein
MIKTALSNPNQYRILLLDSICLLECAIKAQYVEVLEPSRYISYAHLYFEQCKLSGVSFPVHYIQNAKYFFEKHFDHYPKWKISDDYIEYLRVLIILGEYNLAVQVIQCVLSIFEREEDAANYLFYAGCIHKRLNDFNRANHYFFQAIELGPPKLFSKLEMMVILSRVIEDEKAEAGLTNENDSAYQMVHTQFVIEGELHDSVDYEDWIGSYQTWFAIGQKCAVHGMYSLAREFYMLGISQDRTAFHHANLWFAFAKACFRSGRNDEAKLAIRVSLLTSMQFLQITFLLASSKNRDTS